MSEKKIGKRNVAIALGIICIILIVGLGVAMAYYDSYTSTHSHTNSEYDSLSTQNTNLQNQVASDNIIIEGDNITILNYNATISYLTNQVNQLTFLVTHEPLILVNKTLFLSGGILGDFVLTNYPATVAGYISVQVNQSTNIYVDAGYSIHDMRMDVSTGGIAVFPISSTTNLYVFLGTTDGSTPTVTVMVKYYY